MHSNLAAESQTTTYGTHGRDRVNQDHQIAPFQSQPMRTDVVSPSERDGKTTANIATNKQHCKQQDIIMETVALMLAAIIMYVV